MSQRILELPLDYEDYYLDENRTTDLNGTFGNVTENVARPLTDGEMLTACFIGLLGFAGILMNFGVLVVVYKGKLVKTDHRMLYYIFMTVGDLMFALHTFFNVFSILFKDFYVFKIFAVCLNIQITLGLTSYQWSAVCIILLIIDLTWSVVYPFTENKNKKLFSKLTCIVTFFIALVLSLAPFLYWNDHPAELTFCSIGNVYGVHWDEYQQLAVTFLTVLLLTMILACISLLVAVYRTNKPVAKPERAANPPDARDEKEAICHSPHPHTKDKIVSISGGLDETKLAPNAHNNSTVNGTELGQVNLAFQSDGEVKNTHGGRTASKQFQDSELADALKEAWKNGGRIRDNQTQADIRQKRFLTACRTVMFFVATYIGCCLPYYVLLLTRIGCTSCTEDTPDARRTRTIVAATLYLLPIVDPILYIKRFKLFNQTLAKMLTRLRKCYSRM